MLNAQNIIDALWNFNDPVTSESRFREACQSADDDALRLELCTQVVRALGLQRRFDQGHAALDHIECELSTRESDSRFAASRVRCLLERGRLFNSAGERAKALPKFEESFHAAREIGDDHLAVDAAHMIAIVHGAEQHHELALEWNRRALEMAETSAQLRARQWQGSLHNNLGWTLHTRGEFKDALQHFQQAHQARIDHAAGPEDICAARWCIARCLRSLGRFEEALALQRDLEREDDGNDGFVFEEIAECLLALNRDEEARPYFAKALNCFSKSSELPPGRIERLQRLAASNG